MLLVLLGLGIYLYPNFREWRTRQEVNRIMEDFDKTFSQGISDNEETDTPAPSVPSTETPESPDEPVGNPNNSGNIPPDVSDIPEEPASVSDENSNIGTTNPESAGSDITAIPVPESYGDTGSSEPVESMDPENTDSNMDPDIETADNTPKERPYQDLYDTMSAYNADLSQGGQRIVDAWSYEQEPFDLSGWSVFEDTPTIGYIDIPDMEVVLPLFLGASPENLEKGAAVLSQTSMPIGGESTNCVIAGHRGWEGSAYFQYVENMKLGSKVYVTNPWETLVYECTEIQIIYPDDVNAVLIRPGKDLITLFTCHPYVFGGGPYRYLVFCERVDTQERREATVMENPKSERPKEGIESVKPDAVGVVASSYSTPGTQYTEPDLNIETPGETENIPDVSVSSGASPEEVQTSPGPSDSPSGNPSSAPSCHSVSPGTAEAVDQPGTEQPDAEQEEVSAPSDYQDSGFDLLALEKTLRYILPVALIAVTVLLAFLNYRKQKKRRKKKRKKTRSSKGGGSSKPRI